MWLTLRFMCLYHSWCDFVRCLQTGKARKTSYSMRSLEQRTCFEMLNVDGWSLLSSPFPFSWSSIFNGIVRSSISQASSVLMAYSLNLSWLFLWIVGALPICAFLQIENKEIFVPSSGSSYFVVFDDRGGCWAPKTGLKDRESWWSDCLPDETTHRPGTLCSIFQGVCWVLPVMSKPTSTTFC